MTIEGLPLRHGDEGFAVEDLHKRLSAAGHSLNGSVFDDATDHAVRLFQTSRRIEVDGVVGRHTWAALIEAAHRLGARLLYQKSSPMLRGDDVAALQQRLGALGFDAGRVDGIFGPETATALQAFQRNAGLPTDGIFGPASLAALQRLGGRESAANVASVRENERLLRTDSYRTCKVMVGEFGGLGGPVDTCRHRLTHSGLSVQVVSHPDESRHANLANQMGMDLYLGLMVDDEHRCTASFFSTEGFESVAGRHLATLLVDALGPTEFRDPMAMGQRLPILRETRMPAVMLRVGPPALLMANTAELAEAVSSAVVDWAAAPSDAVGG